MVSADPPANENFKWNARFARNEVGWVEEESAGEGVKGMRKEREFATVKGNDR